MKYCSQCGGLLTDDPSVKYCPSCGAPVGKPATTNISPAPPASNLTEKQKKILLGGVAVILCAALGTGIRLFRSRGPSSGEFADNSDAGAPSSASLQAEASPSSPASTSYDVVSGQQEDVLSADAVASDIISAFSDPVIFRGVPENISLTVNGQSVDFSVLPEAVVLDKSVLGEYSQIRVIRPNADGNFQTQVIWFNSHTDNEYTFPDGEWADCDPDGMDIPSTDYLTDLAEAYYRSFLTAINQQDPRQLAFCTERNQLEQNEHIFSSLNNQSEWQTDSFSVEVDNASIQCDSGRVMFNASFGAYRVRHENGETLYNYNHRTLEVLWSNGQWLVNDIEFLSDKDFVQHIYADLEK